MNTQKKMATALAAVIGISAAVAGGFAARSASAHPTILAAARVVAGHHEAHPGLAAAFHSLASAEKSLSAADHDFGGHRLRALALTQQAMSEIRLAVQYDGSHSNSH